MENLIHQYDDSIETLNRTIITQLAHHARRTPRKYPLSRVADIIHRTILIEHLQPESRQELAAILNDPKARTRGIKSGQMMKAAIPRTGQLPPQPTESTGEQEGAQFINIQANEGTHLHSYINRKATIRDKQSRIIHYENIVFPGEESDKVFAAMDQLEKRIDWQELSQDQILTTIALCTISTSSTHGYWDANGRVAVGIAMYMIEKYSPFTLNLQKLNTKNEQLIKVLNIASLYMLPEEYNPKEIVTKLKRGDEITVDILDKLEEAESNHSLHDRLVRDSFKVEFAENISTNLDLYLPGPDMYYKENGIALGQEKGHIMPNEEVEGQVIRLAALFKDSIEPKSERLAPSTQ